MVDPAEAASSPVGSWVDRATREGDRLLTWCVRTPDLPFFISWDVPPELYPGRAAARHPGLPLGISSVHVSADRAWLRDWLGGATLPVRVAGDGRGLRAVSIVTTGGELLLR